MTAPKPKLRWFQFSLRTLLVVVTLCAIPCSWLAVKLRQARRERAAATAIEKLGGQVEWSKPSGPAWLRSFVGDDSFKTVKGVDVWGSEEAPPGMGLAKGTRSEDTDAALQNLTVMNQLQRLYLNGSHITDAGLGNLKESNQLQSLDLHEAKVTDAGLENLKQLHQLQWLDINGTDQITDAGLANLQGLNQLRALYLSGTHVTDAGLEYLQGFTQLQTLDVSHTQVTDAGLEYLRGFTQLQTLSVGYTEVTDAGVKKLQQALPNCTIIY